MFSAVLAVHILIAFLIALIIGALLTAFFRRKEGLAGFALVFFTLGLIVWAGGIWIIPFGPIVLGAYPFPFILTGLVLALFAAAMTGYRPRRTAATGPAGTAERSDLGPLAVVFWILIGVLALLIVARYLRP
jgi:disulfide bond formation protein DsbB